MITLDTTTRSLEAVLSGAVTTNQLTVVTAYADVNDTAGTVLNDAFQTITNNTTAVTILAAPGANVSRILEYASVYNKDTVSATVTIRYNDNATIREEYQQALSPGQTLQYTRQGGWQLANSPFAVSGTFWQATQPVSGIVTANLGTTASDRTAGPTTLAAAGDVSVATSGCGSAVLTITGTATGVTCVVQAQDAAGNWKNIPAWNLANNTFLDIGSNISTGAVVLVPCAGWANVRAHLTAISSGSLIFQWEAGAGSNAAFLLGGSLPVTQGTIPWIGNMTQWGSTTLSTALTLADNLANPTVPQVGACGELWDSVNARWVRMPAPINVSVLASLSRNTTQQVYYTNYGWKSATVLMNVTAFTGTSMSFQLAGQDANGIAFVPIQPTQITSPGLYILELGPGCGGLVTNTNLTTSRAGMLPPYFYVAVIHTSCTATYSIGLMLN